MKISKTVMAVTAVTIYILCPAYRYWVIGAWVGHKIMNDKPRFTKIPKGTKIYNRLVGKAV